MSQAKDSLRELVAHVYEHADGLIDGMTYQELATRIRRLDKHGRGHAHGMGAVLGEMGHLLQGLEGEWGEPIPHIQSLVVNKSGPNRGLPDDGIREFWPDYPRMTRGEKETRVRIEHQRVVAFGSRWNDVLVRLGLRVLSPEYEGAPRGKGGESEAHRRLKLFVKENPQIVGAELSWESFCEYPTPSLDEIDVFFRSPERCIGVEVKAAVSDAYPVDYERGLYQVVKYRALLEAMRSDPARNIPPAVKVVLVLESTLPSQYRGLMTSLGIDVFERIIPGKGA